MEENVRHLPYRLPEASSRDRWRPQDEGARFWARVDRQPGGCWLWTGAPNRSGYGTFRRARAAGRRMVLVHRLAYELRVGPIPPGLTLDHLCGVPLCVRPSHLEPVTASENLRRRHARRRAQIGAPS